MPSRPRISSLEETIRQRTRLRRLGPSRQTCRRLSRGPSRNEEARFDKDRGAAMPFDRRAPQTRDGVGLTAGALLAREWNGKLERVMILEEGFAWNGQTFGSLSQIAKAMTGTNWNGHRFFGLRQGKTSAAEELPQPTKAGRSLGGIAGSGERTVGTSERVTLQL